MTAALLIVVPLVAADSGGAAGQETVDWAARAARRLPQLQPCERPGAQEPLLCGTIEVWEDRAAASGRRIGLEVVVVPAHADNPPPEPVVIFAGGPGGAATARAVSMTYVPQLRDRDVLLVDQRGTGGSNPLDCDIGAQESEAPGQLPDMYPAAQVARCAEDLATRADIGLYTSDHHADDIEEVRQRLGYGPLHLNGGSYGTRAAMVFAQRHPDSVRTLFLIGTDSPLRSNLAERGQSADRALRGVADLCAADAGCSALVPDMAASLARVLARLEAGPRRVAIHDPHEPDRVIELEVGRQWLTEQTRLLLYYVFTSRALPWAVHRAELDDWEPLVQLAVVIDRMFQSSLADGLGLTVQCSEGMDFDTDAALAAGNATLFGNYRLEQQLQGCAIWPHDQKPPLGVTEPRPLPIPTIFLSGNLDAVTPPAYANEAAAYLPESHHIVLPGGQHGPYDLENSWQCVHDVWAELIAEQSVDDLDLSCTANMTRPPFLLDAHSFAAHLHGELASL